MDSHTTPSPPEPNPPSPTVMEEESVPAKEDGDLNDDAALNGPTDKSPEESSNAQLPPAPPKCKPLEQTVEEGKAAPNNDEKTDLSISAEETAKGSGFYLKDLQTGCIPN